MSDSETLLAEDPIVILSGVKPPATIYVAPLSKVEHTIASRAVSHLVTLINNDTPVPTPASIAKERHLRLAMNDICEPADGLVLPGEHHVAELVRFTLDWHRAAPLLIHCWAGISRSTASMFMALCKLNPGVSEVAILKRMRALAPHIAPNRLLVAHADDLLGRDGRMVDALDEIGPAIPASEGFLFELPAAITQADL